MLHGRKALRKCVVLISFCSSEGRIFLQSNAARAGLSGALAALGAQIGLIDLEVSVGRLGLSDLERFAPEIRALGFRASSVHPPVFTNGKPVAVAFSHSKQQ
jgi:hypothetical protein